jgi:hypothetical protein
MTHPNGIIDFFLHPTFNFLTSSTTNPSVIANPLSGTNVLAATVGIASSFGIVWGTTAPPQAGFTVGVLDTFEFRVFDLAVFHTLASGLVVVSQRFQTHESNGILFWENLVPTNVSIEITPGFQLTVEWIIGI